MTYDENILVALLFSVNSIEQELDGASLHVVGNPVTVEFTYTGASWSVTSYF